MKQHTSILGIDPGLSGGWALIDHAGRFLDAQHFPTRRIKKNGKASTQLDGAALAETLRKLNASHAFVEVVSSRPRQAGQFQFGVNCGLVHGILHAHQIPFELVAPASWKALFGIKRLEDQTKADTKSEARSIAAKLYPDHAAKFSRVKDDGPAEATLIAVYGLSKLSQQ